MLVFVDCEAYGGSPSVGQLTEFGAVTYPKLETFHGVIIPHIPPDPKNPAVPDRTRVQMNEKQIKLAEYQTFRAFDEWLSQVCGGKQGKNGLYYPERPVFVSDNVAFDWQWINDCFWRHLNRNPFGHSGRRISDFYAGLTGDWRNTQKWKKLRITKHDHHPVHDALGNAEAFRRMMDGERP